MATDGSRPVAVPSNMNTAQSSTSPPSKRELASWWKKFRKTAEKDEEKPQATTGIFGVPLTQSIQYANVAISLTNEDGENFVYGFVPIIVAKCGILLKEKATEIEGIFRLSGSAKRIKDLQAIFDSPDRYGKGLDWTGYTVHDAANIFRRYLNNLPEPIVPLDFYERFRDPLRTHQAQAVGDMDGQDKDVGNFDHENAVVTYQKLITELPGLNRQLLLYILDLLAVFASKADINRMNSANLAAIFQPGIISHPSHDMAPSEYRLSQDVLIFLIENQDNFLFGMSGTAVDEKTVQDMQSASRPRSSPKTGLGRSASDASAGADSARKNARRNSLSSPNSKTSTGAAPSPGTPSTPLVTSSGSVQRSNTLPTKRSPALAPGRFQRAEDPSTPKASEGPQTPKDGLVSSSDQGTLAGRQAAVAATLHSSTPERESTRAIEKEGLQKPPAHQNLPSPSPVGSAVKTDTSGRETGKPLLLESKKTAEKEPSQNWPSNLNVPAPGLRSPGRERKISSFFARSPILGPRESDGEQKEGRQPNKLRKKQRIPGSANESAQSSQNSLQAESSHQTFHTPLVSPDLASHNRLDPLAAATSEMGPPRHPAPGPSPGNDGLQAGLNPKGPKSPEASVHSRSSYSDYEGPEEQGQKGKTRRRWHFASKKSSNGDSPLAPPPPIGQNGGARGSNSSLGSSNRPRKSMTNDSRQTTQTNDSATTANPSVRKSEESSDLLKDSTSEPEKRGIFGKWKAKIGQSKEERKEREAEKEKRAKSPSSPSFNHDQKHPHTHSLTAFATEHLPHRGRSIDQPRDQNAALPSVKENEPVTAPQPEALTSSHPNTSLNPEILSPIPPTPITAIRMSPDSNNANAGTIESSAPDTSKPAEGIESAAPATTATSGPNAAGELSSAQSDAAKDSK